MLDLIGINLYLGTDRLLRPRGGRGFSEKCGVTKLYPAPPPNKKLHMKKNCTPLGNNNSF